MPVECDDFPIEELMNFIFDGKRGHLGVLHQGMIDDSADRDRQKAVISTAMIGDQKQWHKLRTGWRTRLSLDEIEYYKDSHCRNLRGQFFKYNSLDKYPPPLGRQRAEAVRDDLDAIIKDCKLLGVACIIPIPLWKQLQNDRKYAPVVAKDPYHWAVQTVWMLAVEVMRKGGRGNIITFAHDECENFPVLHDLYLGYKKLNKQALKVMAGFIPLDDKTNPPIQAADVAASATHRLAIEWVDKQDDPSLKRLNDSMYRIAIWDEYFAKRALDTALESKAASV